MVLRAVLDSVVALQMRKRSKYRPREVRNPLAYVLESMTPLRLHESYLIDLKIKNHAAMTALTQGRATRGDIDTLIPMGNVAEALYRLGFGTEYEQLILTGLDALFAVARRGADSGRFVLRSEEMNALNDLMELHDAQMDAITLRDMERALEIIKKEHAAGRMRLIKEKA